MHGRPATSTRLDFLSGGGEMGALIRAHDWATTPLGPADGWPSALKTLVGVMLGSNQPMFVAWGAGRTVLYNDAYAGILVRKHPDALGRDLLEVWHEIRPKLGPIVERAYAGEPIHMDDITFVLERRGYPEEAHFSFSYTPVRDESGAVGGFFCPCTEITRQVMAERRLASETQRQRHLFEQAPGFITVLAGPEHRFEFVNQAYRRLFGDRDFVGRTVREVFPELEGQGFYEWLDQVHATGERFVAHQMPIRLRASSDTAAEERFLDFIYEPVRDETGRVTGIFCEGHDVSERMRAEARQAFLLRLGDAVRPLRDAVQIQAEACRLLGEHLSVAQVGFGEVDGSQEHVTVHRDWNDGRIPSVAGTWHMDDFGPAFTADLRRGETVAIPDIARDPRTMAAEVVAAYEGIRTRALLDVPLVRDGRLVATLFIHHPEPRTWAPADIEIVQETCGRLWDAVERARAEAALRTSEERLASVLEQVPVGVGVFDAQGRYTLTNPRLRELAGDLIPSRDDQDGPRWQGFDGNGRPIPREDYPGARILRGEDASTPVDFRHVERDGTERWLRVSVVPVRNGSGAVAGGLAVVQDVTGELRTLRSLRASEAQSRLAHERNEEILESISDAFYAVDREWRFTYVNRKAEEWWKRSRQDLIGKVYWDEFPVAVGSKAYEAHQLAMRERRSVHLETVSPILNHWVDIDIHPIAGGGLSVYFRDSTERKQAEAALRESEEFTRRILESSTDCIKVLDPDARLRFMSPGGMEVMEVDDFGAIEGCDWRDFWSGPDHDKAQEAVRMALAGANARFQGQAPTMKGRPRWWDVAVTPMLGHDGSVDKLLSVSRDITAAKQWEEHQRLLINELNHRVKNTLATVQSIASQTLRNAETTTEAREAIEARLFALSRAHDVLTRESWEGASLREIVAEAVAPYSNRREDRLHLRGPDVRLPPRMALALAMALQELATNAVKYGALSDDAGEIRIQWMVDHTVEPPRLCLRWEERGGPPVKVPKRRGFGTRLIERSLAQDLDGEVRIAFEPGGIVCTVDAPLVPDGPTTPPSA